MKYVREEDREDVKEGVIIVARALIEALPHD
jgi:hypothetical protein